MRPLKRPRVSSLLRPTHIISPWIRLSKCRPYSGTSATTASNGNGRAVQPVTAVDSPGLDLVAFRQRAFRPEKPLLIKAGSSNNTHESSRQLPATRRWFEGETGPSLRLASCLDEFAMTHLPYELMSPPQPGRGRALADFHAWLANGQSTTTSEATKSVRAGLVDLLAHYVSPLPAKDDEKPRLIRLEAPLALFLAAVAYNSSLARAGSSQSPQPITQLYIAQASLSDLPPALKDDVPAPDLVKHAGRGDVYDASLWLGLEPTYTPWHRDPNPNLFCQLASSKIVRLMAPSGGERIFREVQTELMKRRQGQSSSTHASSRIRGEEMMQGPERELLHSAVWEDGQKDSGTMHEAHLGAGDMLFIPKGWWHSVKSVHGDGRLNSSVNWWFR